MWAYSLQTSGGGPNNVATITFVDATPAEAGNSLTYELSPLGAAPAYLEYRPKPSASWGRWLSVTDNASFSVTLTDCDVVLELDVTFRNAAAISVLATNNSGATSVNTGSHFFRGLDSAQVSSTAWPIHAAIGDQV